MLNGWNIGNVYVFTEKGNIIWICCCLSIASVLIIVVLLQAVRDGIINQAKGEYRNPITGEVMSIDDALDKNRLVVEEGRPDEQNSDEVSFQIKWLKFNSKLGNETHNNVALLLELNH